MKQLTEELTPKTSKLLILYLLFLSLLELLAYRQGGTFSILASRLWLATAFLCLLLFFITVFGVLVKDIKNRQWLLLFAFALLLFLFCSKIGNLRCSDISFEATLQTAAGLNSFSAEDFNYTGVAFLDYANRQYVLNALPALLFGRSILTLHLGFALPFLIGMTLLFLELRIRLNQKGIREEYALLPLYAMPVFPYITEYFMNFEQTLTPVSFTMMGLSLLLRFYRRRDIPGVLALSFLGGMCCNAYTPVLAFFGFLLVFLTMWGMQTLFRNCKNRKTSTGRKRLWQAALCFALVLQLCCYFAATLVTRQKDMITTAKPGLSLLKATLISWLNFFTDTEGFFWGLWLLPVILYLFLSLTGMLKLPHFMVSVWMLLTVFFSGTLAGYTTYAKAHEIQRNMLIIPVFTTAFFFAAVLFFRQHPVRLPRFVLPGGLLVLLLLGQFNFSREHHSFTYYRFVQPMKYMISHAEDTLSQSQISDTEEFNLILLTDNSLLGNLSDYTAFFYPNAHAYVAKPEEFSAGAPAGPDFTLPTFVFCEIAEFPEGLEGNVTTRTYKNTRYHSTITWYCVRIDKNAP